MVVGLSLIAATSTQLVSIICSFKPIMRHREDGVLIDIGLYPVVLLLSRI